MPSMTVSTAGPGGGLVGAAKPCRRSFRTIPSAASLRSGPGSDSDAGPLGSSSTVATNSRHCGFGAAKSLPGSNRVVCRTRPPSRTFRARRHDPWPVFPARRVTVLRMDMRAFWRPARGRQAKISCHVALWHYSRRFGDRPAYHRGFRRQNRRKSSNPWILFERWGKVDTVWRARDLADREGRRAGPAMTDETHLSDMDSMYVGHLGLVKATRTRPVREMTAGAAWEVLRRLERHVFLWNTFRFDPHLPSDSMSSRQHQTASILPRKGTSGRDSCPNFWIFWNRTAYSPSETTHTRQQRQREWRHTVCGTLHTEGQGN